MGMENIFSKTTDLRAIESGLVKDTKYSADRYLTMFRKMPVKHPG